MTSADALNLVRNRDIDFPTLQRAFGASEAFVAGLVDAVTGDDDWTLYVEGAIPQGERDDYEAGFRHGGWLVEDEANAEGWRECYAVAAAEAAMQAVPASVYGDDIPF